MSDTGKWLKLDENGFPSEIVTKAPERGVQLVAPNAAEDSVAKDHIRAAEEAIKVAKSDAAEAKKVSAVKSSDLSK
ncbi:MAG: hypothetical protein ACXVGE_22440 [Blastococcus sp.]